MAVNHYYDDEDGQPFHQRSYLDVFTIDPGALTASTTQTFAFKDVLGEVAGDGRTIALGVPSADSDGERASGAVRLYTPSASDASTFEVRTVLTQDSKGVPGTSEEYDLFGTGVAMRDGRLAIGAPTEEVGNPKYRSTFGQGSVQPILWNESKLTYTAYRRIDQDTQGVPGSSEDNDLFGYRVVIGRGLTASGSYDILISAQGEDVGSARGAGSLTVANVSRSLYRAYTQATAGVPGSPEDWDEFGLPGVLPRTSGADVVLVSAPGENRDLDGVPMGSVILSDGRKLSSSTKWTSIPAPTDGSDPASDWGWHVGAQPIGSSSLVGE